MRNLFYWGVLIVFNKRLFQKCFSNVKLHVGIPLIYDDIHSCNTWSKVHIRWLCTDSQNIRIRPFSFSFLTTTIKDDIHRSSTRSLHRILLQNIIHNGVYKLSSSLLRLYEIWFLFFFPYYHRCTAHQNVVFGFITPVTLSKKKSDVQQGGLVTSDCDFTHFVTIERFCPRRQSSITVLQINNYKQTS